MLKPHNYQLRAIKFAEENQISAMFLDAGLGKTMIALNFIKSMKIPALVLSPLRPTYATWPAEIKKWTPSLTWTILHGSKKDTKIRLRRNIYLMNYEGLKWFYNSIKNGRMINKKFMLIIDESSFIKAPDTQRFKLLRKLTPIWTPYRMLLTATPRPNGYHELWSQYFMLDSGRRLKSSFYTYRNRYFFYTGPPIYKTTIRPGSEEQIHNKIKDITFRLDAKDYLELPPITYNTIRLVLPKPLKTKYDVLEKDFYLEFNKDTKIELFNAASLSMKLRQFVQGGVYTDRKGAYEKIHTIKVAALKELIESSAGQPILAAIQFKFELDMIRKQLGDIPVIAGGTKAQTAAAYLQDWDKGNIPLLLCHPLSLAHGVNMQTGGRIILWYGIPWSLEQYYQLNRRLHRQGQKQAVVVHHLIFERTIDDIIMGVLRNKDKTQQSFLDALRKEALKYEL